MYAQQVIRAINPLIFVLFAGVGVLAISAPALAANHLTIKGGPPSQRHCDGRFETDASVRNHSKRKAKKVSISVARDARNVAQAKVKDTHDSKFTLSQRRSKNVKIAGRLKDACGFGRVVVGAHAGVASRQRSSSLRLFTGKAIRARRQVL